MSLRARLSLTITILTLLVVTGFSGLAYLLFVRQQDAQLRGLLEEDLARIAALLDRPTLGASFAGATSTSFVLQFVTPDNHIVLSWGSDEPLPFTVEPKSLQIGERTYLVGQAPWVATDGTIRLAHDVSSAFRSRVELARSLLLTSLLIALLASLGGLISTRRALKPLERVTQQTRQLEPTSPKTIDYRGPKDEIHALTDALNNAINTIRNRQFEERAFLLEVAHELAAPLTLVNYHLATVRSEHPTDSRLFAAAEAAQELLRTSQDLLVLARGELERPLEFEILNLRDLLERLTNEYPGLRIEVGAGDSEVVGDPGTPDAGLS